jgi:2-polyprenyl-6-methoxyphenol hydroxylase-like FAD-dependent oxidoreductase
MFDIAIVGAGPAGSSAALAARRLDATVVLLDRATFPRDKACGDGITPHALTQLSRLGVADTTAGYPPVPIMRLVSPGAHLTHSATAAALGRRGWILDGAIRAARANADVFDRLIALGLGDGRLDLRSTTRIARGVIARVVAGRPSRRARHAALHPEWAPDAGSTWLARMHRTVSPERR